MVNKLVTLKSDCKQIKMGLYKTIGLQKQQMDQFCYLHIRQRWNLTFFFLFSNVIFLF